MQLLQLLQEASTLDIPSLKKAMMKDKRAAQLFQKDLSLDQIEDKDAFLSTIKYWILNNDSVRSFVKSRSDIKELSDSFVSEFRQLRGKDLDEQKLGDLKDFVATLFKEHNSVSKGTMSADLKRELKDWFNANGRFFNLPKWAMSELKSIPSIRPNKRVVVYRGVLFKEHDLGERKTYDGSLEKGNGLKFLQSIKKGGREVELSWDRPSSWTTSKSIADRFAKYGPADSNFGATLQWLGRMSGKKEIDGALGYVISTFANPEDILIDTGMMNASISMKHGDEGEVILAPGTYDCRIVKKYTVAGEVDPALPDVADEETAASKAIEHTVKFGESFQIPEELNSLIKDTEDLRVWNSDALGVLKKPSVFKKLVMNGTTTAVVHSIDKLHEFYKDKLHHLQDDDMRADKFATKEELNRKVKKLKSFVGNFRDKVKHVKFKSDKNYSAVGPKHELTGEEYRGTVNGLDLRTLEKQLLVSGKIDDSSGDRAIEALARNLGVTLPTSAKMSRFGVAKQLPVIDELLVAFYKMVGLSKPDDKNDAIKTMINLIRKAHRNYVLLDEIKSLKAELGELN